MTLTTESLDSSSVIGKYKIIKKIGSGGMGVVYLAEDPELDRKVCIKFLREKYIDDEEIMERFNIEAKNIAKISDNNIVGVYDISECEGMKYLIMEYIEGISLDKLLMERNKILWNVACDYVSQISSALQTALSCSVIHRDIKPSNIILNKKNIIKVTDFGLAKSLNNNEKGITKPGEVLGTPAYMAPEQWNGEKVGPECDVYSLGILFFELLTGDVPYNPKNYMHLIRESFAKPLRNKLQLVEPKIPERIVELIESMLKMNPKERCKLSEVSNTLKNVLIDFKIETSELEKEAEEIIKEKKPSELSTVLEHKESVLSLYFKNEQPIFTKLYIILFLSGLISLIIYTVISLMDAHAI